ncbi:poly-beta-hydroxybutyrate polymerase domain protein [Burkholderia mallei]|nr:poly-beta-hydroxybutyrate polymerase domain protein [Burkholderia mallei]
MRRRGAPDCCAAPCDCCHQDCLDSRSPHGADVLAARRATRSATIIPVVEACVVGGDGSHGENDNDKTTALRQNLEKRSGTRRPAGRSAQWVVDFMRFEQDFQGPRRQHRGSTEESPLRQV